MSENDTSHMQVSDISEALGLLTRLPVRSHGGRGVAAAWAWPLAGVAVGLIGAVTGGIVLLFGASPELAAGFAVAAMIISTGALHEDGLADCADGFWGGHTFERRLDIMKDSRIGTYGVLALVLSVLLRWLALAALFSDGYVLAAPLAVGVLSRVPMVALMGKLAPARRTGLSGSMGQPDTDQITRAGIVALIIGLLTAGVAVIPLALMGAGVFWGMKWLAERKIGGQTGDVLGAAQQLAEILMLAALVAAWV